jgi:hypothetical protein
MAEPLYPKVNIVNSTDHPVSGTVKYLSPCNDDNYTIPAGPGRSWTGPYRGVCLVTDISGEISGYGPNYIHATPYSSSGTSYSEFAVIQTQRDPPEFQVTRRISAELETAGSSEETVAAE